MHLHSTSELLGDNVVLQSLTASDVDARYVDWLNDPEVNRFLESRFAQHTLESVKDFVQSQCDDPRVHFWRIIENESSTHVGNIKLGPIDPHHGVADIGLMIGDGSFRGRGIGSQSVRLVTEFALETLQLPKVTAHAYEVNEPSIRLFQSLGFQVEGRLRSHRMCDGKRITFVAMGKLRGE
ncbi:GNAT family N-acetyltransferase [Rhodopirellula europaea]|uniref:GCN5-related N-acetyltransferase n=1 Tax=Rhodopirellula europaea SH398 TaxID=1263868 RepID=M5SAS9_9BACT|nr:GNAT family N-acetyltransferase [Rhodopirellula europaea]EMI24767.1 GCN5-related N-acetyltransferase [Rhodopirellula europaea SH398]